MCKMKNVITRKKSDFKIMHATSPPTTTTTYKSMIIKKVQYQKIEIFISLNIMPMMYSRIDNFKPLKKYTSHFNIYIYIYFKKNTKHQTLPYKKNNFKVTHT